MPSTDRYGPQALAVLRIVAAFLFIAHGTSKLFGFPPFMMGDPPEVGTLFWFAGVIELFGGLLVLFGIYARQAAVLMAGEMAVGYWMIHAAKGPFPSNNGGDAPILFCFVFLLIAAAGPGPWSIDASRMPRAEKDRRVAEHDRRAGDQ